MVFTFCLAAPESPNLDALLLHHTAMLETLETSMQVSNNAPCTDCTTPQPKDFTRSVPSRWLCFHHNLLDKLAKSAVSIKLPPSRPVAVIFLVVPAVCPYSQVNMQR